MFEYKVSHMSRKSLLMCAILIHKIKLRNNQDNWVWNLDCFSHDKSDIIKFNAFCLLSFLILFVTCSLTVSHASLGD